MFSKTMADVNNALAHPLDQVDLHGVARHAEEDFLEEWGAEADWWNGTKMHADFTGAMLNAMHSLELLRQQFFPFFPAFDMAQLARMKTRSDRETALLFGRYLDGLDLVQGKQTKPKEHLETWQRVLTTDYPIAQSKKELVGEWGIVKLYRYTAPEGAKPRNGIPLLLVFAVMNTYKILDFVRGNSFVEDALMSGRDVFLIDWGFPTKAEKDWSFDTYALKLLPQIAAQVKKLSGSEKFSILGWCLGAVISTIYAAMRPHEGLENLILLTAPLDYSDPKIEFGTFLKPINVPKMLEAYGGLMPGHLVRSGSEELKPVANGIGNFIDLWNNLDKPKVVDSRHAMSTWLREDKDMAGAFYLELSGSLYRENLLVKGQFKTTEGYVNLADVTANTLFVVAKKDHITIPSQTKNAFPLFTGSQDKTLFEADGGHISLIMSKKTRSVFLDWLEEHSQLKVAA